MSNKTTKALRVLLVDDDEDDYVVTRDILGDISGENYILDWVNNFDDGQITIAKREHDVYLLDFRLGAHNGLELLTEAHEAGCIAPLILLTGQGGKEIDQAAMAAGAADYLVKDNLNSQQLERSIRYSLKQAQTLEALKHERESLSVRVAERTRDLSLANIELAKAAKAKDEFLASMSHELRTPLTGILAMSEVLSRELYGPLNEKQKNYLHTMEESGQHLLTLINDILDIAKIEVGKFELNYSRVQVRPVCESAMRLIQQNARKKNQTVTLDIEFDSDYFECDERRLKQMLVNLLGNAVKFTPEHGNIGLEVRGDSETEKILFTVWDDGIGIPQDRIEQLFQPFVQLDSSLSRQYQGTGLGLALVARMVKLHSGEISVDSSEGQGSRFSLILPAPKVKPPKVEDIQPIIDDVAVAPRGVKTVGEQAPLILLAEDDEINVMIYRDDLENLGYQVQVANDGVQALEKVEQQKPDLILMDIQMPRMDGLQAIRQLRQSPENKNLPIIALTALAMDGDLERCLEAGANKYLSKPLKLTELEQAIHKLLVGN